MSTPPSTEQRAVAALQRLAASSPLTEINYGQIAAEAGLPWQTVRKLLGERERFDQWLNYPEDAAKARCSDSHHRILDSAAKVFARKGYHGATLDEVAADAGLTKGAVYWNFNSKSDLFFALLQNHFTRNTSDLPERLAKADSLNNPLAGLQQILTDSTARITTDPDWPRLFFEFIGQTRDPAIRARIGECYREFYQLSIGIIEHGRAQSPQNCNAQVDSFTEAVFWEALIDGLILAWLVNPELIKLDQIVPKIAELAWRGVAAPAACVCSPPPSRQQPAHE